MCGILAILEQQQPIPREQAIRMAQTLKHRGPDEQGIYADDQVILLHQRLSIIDVHTGRQPITDVKQRVLVANGEIYRHKELRSLCPEYVFRTESDSEILLALYDTYKSALFEHLDGMYAFVLYDPTTKELLIGRDHIGIIPLYWGRDAQGTLYVASELKAIEPYCTTIEQFPPGSYYDGTLHKWYEPEWKKTLPAKELRQQELYAHLHASVQQQLISDVPLGVLISGGLDSSAVAALAKQHKKTLHSFSIGLKGSPDLLYARKVAQHLGTIHHERTFSTQEGIDALEEVIRHLETYDVTTIRASTPMYLLSRYIRSIGIKVVLSGEGADELFGGYLYFHLAPDKKEFHEETVRKLAQLHKYDCLRANKATMAWGVEARVPFLSKEFIEYVMTRDPEQKMCQQGVEKWALRKAVEHLLPKEIVWRQKEQFSDGVGYSWIDGIKEYAEQTITDEELALAQTEFVLHTPDTKEALLYRRLFAKHYPGQAAAKTVLFQKSIACSTPKALEWSQHFIGKEDPSGRAIQIHAHTIAK